MLIGLDICNTLADVNSRVADALDTPVDALVERYGIERLGLRPGWFDGHPEVFADALPVPGSREVVDALASAGARIVYVTARPEKLRGITRAWLRRWGFPQGSLVMGLDKARVARALRIALFFEDCPRDIAALREVCPVRVIGWPYNGCGGHGSGWSAVLGERGRRP